MAADKLPAARARDVVRALEKAGFEKWRQKGSPSDDVLEVRRSRTDGTYAFRQDCTEGNLAHDHSKRRVIGRRFREITVALRLREFLHL